MGKIITSLTITNRLDEAKAKDGLIKVEQIRSIKLDNVLVDTGATTLALPKKYIEQLGLEKLKTVAVSTATGIYERSIYRDATINLCDRIGTFECIEISNESQPLLGVIPLEMLGIELDLQTQTLKFLPDDVLSTYITVY